MWNQKIEILITDDLIKEIDDWKLAHGTHDRHPLEIKMAAYLAMEKDIGFNKAINEIDNIIDNAKKKLKEELNKNKSKGFFKNRCYNGGNKHKFSSRYSEQPRNIDISNAGGMTVYDVKRLTIYNEYKGDVCEWCGKVVNVNKESK